MLTLDCNMDKRPDFYFWIEVGMAVLLTLTFLVLQIMTYRHHHYEYKKNRNASWIFFFSFIFIYLFWLSWIFLFRNQFEDETQLKKMQEWVDYYLSLDNINLAQQIIFQTYIRNIIVATSILVFKNTHDVLEGINKLDNTLVVSRYQREIMEQLANQESFWTYIISFLGIRPKRSTLVPYTAVEDKLTHNEINHVFTEQGVTLDNLDSKSSKDSSLKKDYSAILRSSDQEV